MKVLLTGARGFVGAALMPLLQKAGHEVIAWGRAEADLTRELPDIRFDAVIHLAAKTGILQSHEDPNSFFEVNTKGTRRLAELAAKLGARFVFLSTCAYGEPDILPVPETHPLRPNNPYSESKKQAEEAIQEIYEARKLPYCILRLFNVYGPGQDRKFLIPFLLEQFLSSTDALELMNTDSVRDYVYLPDAVQALVTGLESSAPSGVYNIGTGVGSSADDVLRELAALTGRNKKIISKGQYKPNEVRQIYADMTKTKKLLGWQARWNLHHGLKDYVEKTMKAST